MRRAEPKNQWQAMVECEEKLWWYRALHGFLFRLLDRTDLPPEARVLDIGCGTGGFMKRLRERFDRVVGLDLSWLGLTHTRSRGFPSVLMADANHLPFSDNCFDLVVCIDVLEEKTGGSRSAARGDPAGFQTGRACPLAGLGVSMVNEPP